MLGPVGVSSPERQLNGSENKTRTAASSAGGYFRRWKDRLSGVQGHALKQLLP